jgi:hypothetical protein
MEGTFKTSRTDIIMPASSFGPNRSKILEAWEKARGDNVATMRVAYEEDGVRLLLYPFNSYEVECSAEVPKSAQTDVKWIRRLVMPGLIPQTSADDKHLTRNTIIENYWVPIKKCCGTTSVLRPCGKWQNLTDDERTDLRYIAMLFARNDGSQQTTMEFYIDKRAYREAGGMKPDRWVAHMLDIATELLAESLRHVIEKADPHTLTAAATMNELSAAFADELGGLIIL